jgi:hypothetical protein
MDEGLIIKADGRVVGVVVPVRDGFMFFSSDADLKVLEATIFPRIDMVAPRVAEIRQAKKRPQDQAAMAARPNWRAPAPVAGG